MCDVVPGGRGILRGNPGAPLLPGQELEIWIASQPPGNPLRVSAKAQGGRRDHVEALSHGGCPVLDCPAEGLGHIVCVNVMDGFLAEIRKRKTLAPGERLENRWVEIPGRVQRHPPPAHDVARVEHGHRETTHTGMGEQP